MTSVWQGRWPAQPWRVWGHKRVLLKPHVFIVHQTAHRHQGAVVVMHTVAFACRRVPDVEAISLFRQDIGGGAFWDSRTLRERQQRLSNTNSLDNLSHFPSVSQVFSHVSPSLNSFFPMQFCFCFLDVCFQTCLLNTSPSPRDISGSRMPSSA